MSCGYPSAIYYKGPGSDGKVKMDASLAGIRGFCTINDALKEQCGSDYVADGTAKIPFKDIQGKTYKKCIGDIVKSPRYAKKCRKIRWNTIDSTRLACIQGAIDGTKDPYNCGPEMCANTPSSDAFMTQYCSRPENMNKEICACLKPAGEYDGIDTIGPVHCVYNPCAKNPRAYKTQAQIDNKCTIQDINCSIGDIYLEANDGDINDVLIKQACSGVINGEEVSDGTPDGGVDEEINVGDDNIWEGWNWLIIVFLVALIFGGLYLLVRNKNNGENDFGNSNEIISSEYPQYEIDEDIYG